MIFLKNVLQPQNIKLWLSAVFSGGSKQLEPALLLARPCPAQLGQCRVGWESALWSFN